MQINDEEDGSAIENLGISGDRQLSKAIMLNRATISTIDSRLKDLIKIFHNSEHSRIYPFATIQ